MCNKDLEIIKGDTFALNINVNKGIELIGKMYFSSKGLGIEREITHFGENVFQLIITSEETKMFSVTQATYDITIKKVNEQIKTAVYNGYIYVYEKENVVNEY